MKSTYRPELDGIRALAIFLIILSHFENYNFPSGGVNIFFVITGYLITQIIIDKNLKISDFYITRFLKLYPPIFIILLITLILFFFIGDINNWSIILRSFISSALGFTNLYLLSIGNIYGDHSQNPYLPLWAFALIIQFYIIFPLILKTLLFFKKKFDFNHNFLTLSLFIISLILFLFSNLYNNNILYNFYSPLSRFWQFLLGSILFLIIKYQKRLYFNDASIYLGLVLLIIWQLNISFSANWKIEQLLITFATLLILYSTQKSTLSKILSTKPLIYLGKISFLLYIIHNPVIYFVTIWFEQYILVISLFFMILITHVYNKFILSNSYERGINLIFKNKIIIFLSFFLLFLSFNFYFFKKEMILKNEILFKNFVNKNNLLYKTKIKLQNQVNSFIGYNEPQKLIAKDGINCHNRNIDIDFTKNCIFIKDNNKKNLFVLGGSQLSNQSFGLKKSLPEFNHYHITGSLHIYIPNFNKILLSNNSTDIKFFELNNFSKKLLSSVNQETIVLIGARYPVHIEKKYFNNLESGSEPGIWNSYYEHLENPFRKWEEAFKEEIEELAKNKYIKIILLYPIPEVGFHVPNRLTRNYKFFSYNEIDTSYKVFKNRTKSSFQLLNSIKGKDIYRIYPHTFFCNNFIKNRCVTSNKKVIYYYDDDHLSEAGTKIINELIIGKIKEISKD